MIGVWVLWVFGGLLGLSLALNCWQYCDYCELHRWVCQRIEECADRKRLLHYIRMARKRLELVDAELHLADPRPPEEEPDEE